jgi:Na+/melibiose symporter-like transporter
MIEYISWILVVIFLALFFAFNYQKEMKEQRNKYSTIQEDKLDYAKLVKIQTRNFVILLAIACFVIIAKWIYDF